MATMILEVYDALRSAGAPEDKAQAAATVLANMNNLASKADLDALAFNVDKGFSRLDTDVAILKAELALIKWLVGGIGFGVVLLVLKSFWPVH